MCACVSRQSGRTRDRTPPPPDTSDAEEEDASEALLDRTGRCRWVLDNPDLVSVIHAIRVELTVRYVMENVVPSDDENPFLFWLRFEWGSNGNPHAPGQVYVKGHPSFEHVTKDDASKEDLVRRGYPNASELDTEEQAATKLGDFYHQYAKEWHPCKDAGGKALYPFTADNVKRSKERGNPHSVDLLELLEKTLAEDSTDLTELRQLLLALVELSLIHI